MKSHLLAILVLSIPAFAQTSVKDAMVKHWKTSAEFTLAVANTMPADSYNFRPNPEEMSFGQLMAHISIADLGACANASGMTRPALPSSIAAWAKDPQKINVDKVSAISFMEETFDFCNKAVASMTPERFDTVVGPPARNLTGYEWLWSYFTHTAHHRAQAEVYLRVKGIKPPDYKF